MIAKALEMKCAVEVCRPVAVYKAALISISSCLVCSAVEHRRCHSERWDDGELNSKFTRLSSVENICQARGEEKVGKRG